VALLIKKDPRPELLVDAAADLSPDVSANVLAPGEPLAL
jgi:hypothetical protein